ncbi:MAG: type II toxin-antitoxin system HicB family antitoxin [Leptolyngbyaceae cyanobacterium CSU_1_4]|nr:type II toxin-antitoxin system HicB family antitoxin [Leptolyngbyaceae cyanobacterium CSU_1_4]
MLTEYIQAAMAKAEYEILEDGTHYSHIPPCKGVLSNAETHEECESLLREVLEEWIILGFRLGHEIPVIDGIDLNFSMEPEEVA